MSEHKTILFWHRIDVEGTERLELTVGPGGVAATSTVLCLDAGGFRLDHRWHLDPDWHAQSVEVELWNSQGHRMLRLDRADRGWRVDGCLRPDLEGASEPDLSVTPFCNALPIRRTTTAVGGCLTLDTAYIDGPMLNVARSRQQYVRLAPRRVRYIDLGLSAGFEADLEIDDMGLVLRYEGLF